MTVAQARLNIKQTKSEKEGLLSGVNYPGRIDDNYPGRF
jgi:hypothetical protein